MKSWVILSLFLVFSLRLIAQEHRLLTAVSATRFDYFHSFDYSQYLNKCEVSMGIGYGINRSVFQQRLFPKVQLQATYNFIEQPKFQLGPSVYGAFSWLKINKMSNYFTNWSEFYGGLSWTYGGQWKIGQTIVAGYVSERFFNTIAERKTSVGNWGFSVSLKLVYVL